MAKDAVSDVTGRDPVKKSKQWRQEVFFDSSSRCSQKEKALTRR